MCNYNKAFSPITYSTLLIDIELFRYLFSVNICRLMRALPVHEIISILVLYYIVELVEMIT